MFVKYIQYIRKMNMIFSHAKAILSKANKAYDKGLTISEDMALTMKNTIIESEIMRFKNILDIAKELHSVYQEEIDDKKKIPRSYFITVSPKSEIAWETFYHTIQQLINRRCIESAIYSYEQRGKNENEIGKGFHVHILCTSTWRSKGEALNACFSSCKTVCTKENVDVQKIWNTTQWDQKLRYIRDYESNDGHKILTSDTDRIWRDRMNLDKLYQKNIGTLSVTSPGQIEISESIGE